MTNIASHDFEVDDIIGSNFELDSVPKRLLCQTDPCVMFKKNCYKFFFDIKTSIGPEKNILELLGKCNHKSRHCLSTIY